MKLAYGSKNIYFDSNVPDDKQSDIGFLK